MAYRAALLNFSKGEISPEVEARFDLAAYQAGLRRAENVKIKRTGGIAKRMGTRFVAECLGTSSRLIPFQFSDDQAYALEYAQALMRPYALGGAVLEDGLKVTAITKDTFAQVTAAYHDFAVGDPVYFTAIPGMVEINDRFLTVAEVIDEHNFTVNIDSRGFSTFEATDEGIERTGPPDPPPAPPTVPDEQPAPTPPTVGSGGGGYYTGDGTGGSMWNNTGWSIP